MSFCSVICYMWACARMKPVFCLQCCIGILLAFRWHFLSCGLVVLDERRVLMCVCVCVGTCACVYLVGRPPGSTEGHMGTFWFNCAPRTEQLISSPNILRGATLAIFFLLWGCLFVFCCFSVWSSATYCEGLLTVLIKGFQFWLIV